MGHHQGGSISMGQHQMGQQQGGSIGQHQGGGRNEEHDLIARYANRLARFR